MQVLFVYAPDGRSPLVRSRNRWVDNIKVELIWGPHVRWVPVPTAWHVLGLRMEERTPAIEVSCEYIE
jgi:hypothetical protein